MKKLGRNDNPENIGSPRSLDGTVLPADPPRPYRLIALADADGPGLQAERQMI